MRNACNSDSRSGLARDGSARSAKSLAMWAERCEPLRSQLLQSPPPCPQADLGPMHTVLLREVNNIVQPASRREKLMEGLLRSSGVAEEIVQKAPALLRSCLGVETSSRKPAKANFKPPNLSEVPPEAFPSGGHKIVLDIVHGLRNFLWEQ